MCVDYLKFYLVGAKVSSVVLAAFGGSLSCHSWLPAPPAGPVIDSDTCLGTFLVLGRAVKSLLQTALLEFVNSL